MTSRRAYRGHIAGLAAFAVVCLAFFVVLMRAGGTDIVPTDRYEVQAVVPTAVSLVPGAQVRMAGVEVGKVREIAARQGDAVIRFDVEDEYAPIYRDARVRLRLKSLVGENYVDVDAGSPRAGSLPDDGVLDDDQADESVQFDEIVSALSVRTRADLKRTLDGLGGALHGRAGRDLNRTVDTFSSAVESTRPVFDTLRAQRRAVGSLVDDLGRVMRALGDRDDAISTLAHGLRRTTEAVARRDDGLRSTLDALPPTLARARTTAGTLTRVAPRATPVLRDVGSAARGLAPVIDELRPTAAATRTTVSRLQAFAPRGRSLLARLRPVARSATEAMPALDRTLAELNPMLAYMAPYARDIAVAPANLGSVTDAYDATGNVARIHGVYSESTLPGVLTAEQQKALDALLEVGALSKIRKRGNNAYPAPGGTADPKPFNGRYRRVVADPLSDPRSAP